MCHRKRTAADERAAYEGQTVRLSANDGAAVERIDTGRVWHHARFPWWTLWLIWPLAAALKGIVPFIAAVYAAIAAVSVPLLPVLLIAIGLALIMRRNLE